MEENVNVEPTWTESDVTATPDSLKLLNEHREKIAKIAADERVEITRLRLSSRSDRRAYVGYWLFGLAAVTVIVTLVLCIFLSVDHDRRDRDRDHERQAGVARACVAQGSIWVGGNCIPRR